MFAARHRPAIANRLPRLLRLLGVVALGALVNAPAPAETEACLACHADKGAAIEFSQGGRIEAFVDEGQFKASVHGFLACTDCHDRSLTGKGHEQQQFRSEELFKLRYSRICRRCHLDEELGGCAVHARLLEQEAAGRVPVCTDCHPAHAIMPVGGGGILAGETTRCLRMPPGTGPGDGARRNGTSGTAASCPGSTAASSCSGCHAGYSRQSHPQQGVAGSRAGTAARDELCRRCHFDMYTKSLEGIHYQPAEPGPCGVRQVASTATDRTASRHSATTGRRALPSAAGATRSSMPRYASSVHGEALVNAKNQDVPICIDCHRAHDTGDPRTVDYRNDIPFMCGNCHANEAMAGKYGLSTDVVKTYLSDFHGSTVSIYREQAAGAGQPDAARSRSAPTAMARTTSSPCPCSVPARSRRCC